MANPAKLEIQPHVTRPQGPPLNGRATQLSAGLGQLIGNGHGEPLFYFGVASLVDVRKH